MYVNKVWLISQFACVRKLYSIYNSFYEMQQLEVRKGELFIQTFEESRAALLDSSQGVEFMHSTALHGLRGPTLWEVQALQRCKEEENLQDWNIPEYERVGINKRVPLGGDKWTYVVDWD